MGDGDSGRHHNRLTGLWKANQLYLDMVGREWFYEVQASFRGNLHCHADFPELYCLDRGLPNTADLRQRDFDLRWKVSLVNEI